MIRNSLFKILSILLIIGLSWAGHLAIGQTVAHFNDTEVSEGDTFSAGTLDFFLHSGQSNFVPEQKSGNMKPGDKVNRVIQVKQTLSIGGLPFQYTVSFEKIEGDDSFCSALQLKADLQGTEIYNNSLSGFSSSPTLYSSGSDTWQFKLSLPQGTGDELQGKICKFNFVFKGWQDNMADYDDEGFSDIEKIESIIKTGYWNPSVVLNEFLPNPSGTNPDYGFDFGEDNDLMPKGEWVEIYNKAGGSTVDLDGWYLQDQDGNTKYITTSNTNTASTVIGANGSGSEWLVVYMNEAILDNDSEIIYLYDMFDNLIDSYSYDLSAYCTLEPTPGDSNDENASGSCPTEIPGNKSYARIPDGVGIWYDPIPTPGGQNKLEEIIVEEIPTKETPTADEIITTEEITTEATTSEEMIIETEETLTTTIEIQTVTEEASTTTENQQEEEIDEIIEETIIDEEVNTEEAATSTEEAPNYEGVAGEENSTIEPAESSSNNQAGEELLVAEIDNSSSNQNEIIENSGGESGDGGISNDDINSGETVINISEQR